MCLLKRCVDEVPFCFSLVQYTLLIPERKLHPLAKNSSHCVFSAFCVLCTFTLYHVLVLNSIGLHLRVCLVLSFKTSQISFSLYLCRTDSPFHFTTHTHAHCYTGFTAVLSLVVFPTKVWHEHFTGQSTVSYSCSCRIWNTNTLSAGYSALYLNKHMERTSLTITGQHVLYQTITWLFTFTVSEFVAHFFFKI